MLRNEHMSICIDCAKFKDCDYKTERKTFCNNFAMIK